MVLTGSLSYTQIEALSASIEGEPFPSVQQNKARAAVPSQEIEKHPGVATRAQQLLARRVLRQTRGNGILRSRAQSKDCSLARLEQGFWNVEVSQFGDSSLVEEILRERARLFEQLLV